MSTRTTPDRVLAAPFPGRSEGRAAENPRQTSHLYPRFRIRPVIRRSRKRDLGRSGCIVVHSEKGQSGSRAAGVSAAAKGTPATWGRLLQLPRNARDTAMWREPLYEKPRSFSSRKSRVVTIAERCLHAHRGH